jgi:hypothetical protein
VASRLGFDSPASPLTALGAAIGSPQKRIPGPCDWLRVVIERSLFDQSLFLIGQRDLHVGCLAIFGLLWWSRHARKNTHKNNWRQAVLSIAHASYYGYSNGMSWEP